MPKRTVAFDIGSTESDHKFRGIGTYTRQLIEELRKIAIHDTELELITFKDKNRIPSADLYHFPDFSPFFFSFPLSLISKSIVTVHDLIPIEYPQHYPAGIKGNARWLIQKLMLKQARALITDSHASAKSIHKLTGIPIERVHTIYLAADGGFERIKPLEKMEENLVRLSPPTRYILYVGDVNWNKNLMMLATACVELSIPLVVVGKQASNPGINRYHPWNKELVAFQDYANQNKHLIKLYGYVSKADLITLYNWAWCYVQPSIVEGFGLPVLEALSCGCLVLCANTSSLPEIAGDAALYFDPKDPQSLREKLQYIWDTRNSKELDVYKKKSGEQTSKFSWEKTAMQTWNVYKTCI